jgi:hypothetical protein
VDAVRPGDLLYFLLNVGDADTQLLSLPEDREGRRRAVIVDVAAHEKLNRLIGALVRLNLLTAARGRFPLVVATHPHDDHIRGMANFLTLHNRDIQNFWEPGFLGTSGAFHDMMLAVEELDVARARPTAGHVAVVGNVRITVLTPNARLRQQFVTHGVNENNASLALRIEFPAARVVRRNGRQRLVDYRQTSSLVLGADAQFEAWAHAEVDFPQLRTAGSQARRAMSLLVEPNLLSAHVVKVPHHGSKHGIHLELAERVNAHLSLVSSVNGGGRHDFPHALARAILRDAGGADPADPRSDGALGIHYTGAVDVNGHPLGTICVQMRRHQREVWRFRDGIADTVDLNAAERWTGGP